ncbi:hypothetical protein SAMN05892877_10656 [Rhizobium subbaraonis]|uniref:Uncharacterized protein n=2 Tax=Rhizobium subbaraonis TaxID=908946 RepID=A0A285UCL1_9HYPH|nr:hypothetical protein SAMN05892877_10656 [Rhizobium subbaraonis]
MVLGTVLRSGPKRQRANGMTNGQYSGVTERQRGFLGALLLMLALVVGQFVTLERKISFRSSADPSVSRSAAEKLAQRNAPLPRSAGGGTSSGDNWHMAGSSTDRRVFKVKPTGTGGDPFPDVGLLATDAPGIGLSKTGEAKVLARVGLVPAGTPRHQFEGRAPPAVIL